MRCQSTYISFFNSSILPISTRLIPILNQDPFLSLRPRLMINKSIPIILCIRNQPTQTKPCKAMLADATFPINPEQIQEEDSPAS